MKLRELHRDAWILIGFGALSAIFLVFFLIWPFEPMTSLAVAAAILRGSLLTMTGLAAWCLPLSYAKRVGLAGATVGMFMSTQSLLIPHTPWEGWSYIISTSGWLIYALATFGVEVWARIMRLGHR